MILPLLLVGISAGVLYYAWFFPTAPPIVEEITPPTGPTFREKGDFKPWPPPAATPHLSTREPTKPPASTDSTPAPSGAWQLVRRYLAINDLSARMEILHDISEDPLSGGAAFVHLFRGESDPTLKELMVDLAETVGEPNQDLFTLLGMALPPDQPDDVRAAALRVLLLNGDARAIPLWQTLRADSDPDTRELAAEQIALLREM